MLTSILSSGFIATRLPILTPVDIGVFSFLICAFVIAVIVRRIPVLVINASAFIIYSDAIYMLSIRKEEKVDKEKDSINPQGQPEERLIVAYKFQGCQTGSHMKNSAW